MTLPFVPLAQGVQSVLQFTMGGQIMQNVLNFQLTTVPTLSDMEDLNTALHTWWTSHFKSMITSVLGLSQIKTVGLDSPNDPGATLALGSPEFGTESGTVAPYNVAYCISLRTAFRGRSYRGRFYVAGINESHFTTSSMIDPTFAGTLITGLSWLMTPANVADFEWVVFSKNLNKVRRIIGVGTEITAVTGDLSSDSQRRRLPGRGA